MSRKNSPPKYRRHSSGQARVLINGKIHYLGVYGTPESHAEYERLLAQWRAGIQDRPAPDDDLTVADVIAAFLRHVDKAYADSPERRHFPFAFRPLLALFGHTQAAAFGPKALKVVRQRMIDMEWKPRVVNRNVVRIRTAWRWLESEEVVGKGTWESLRTVRGLSVDENVGRPVPEEDLLVSMAFLPHVLWSIAQTQLLTGGRPNEILGLRRGDLLQMERVELAPGVWLRTGGKVWVVNLKQHKMKKRGFTRILLFGPKAQAVLAPFLDRPPEAFLFSPREAVHPKQLLRQKRRIGERYLLSSYGHAIRKACDRAWLPEPWTSYQLRHNAASRLASEFGEQVARIVLGQRDLDTTRGYILDDLAKAVEAIAKAG